MLLFDLAFEFWCDPCACSFWFSFEVFDAGLYDCLEVVEVCCYCGVRVHVSENRFLNVGDYCVFVFVVSVG